jgi:hypothetical protein
VDEGLIVAGSNIKAAPDALSPDLVADFIAWLDRDVAPRVDDLGPIARGHICAHDVRWPHSCAPCDDAAWDKAQNG